MLEDLERWQRKCMKAGKARPFESEDIPAGMKALIDQRLETDADSAFDFLKKTDPARLAAEKRLRAALVAELARQHSLFAKRIHSGEAPDWAEFEASLTNAVDHILVGSYTGQVARDVLTVGIDFDVAVINTAAWQWAKASAYTLVARITETTRNLVGEAVSKFVATPGMTIDDVSALLAPSFGESRADKIAVTELTRAFSAATDQYQIMLGEAGLKFERVWRTSMDEIVADCPICAPMEDVKESEWASKGVDGPPPAHVNCILPGNIVAVPGLIAASKAFYAGRIIEVRTANGRDLAVTANHPILTSIGWRFAKDLRPGDDVITHSDPQRIASCVNPNYQHIPMMVEQVFDALKMARGMAASTMPLTAIDFHGDGRDMDGNVEVVHANGQLLRDWQPRSSKPVGQQGLGGDNVLPGKCHSRGPALALQDACLASASRGMGIGSEVHAVFGSHMLHSDGVGFTDSASRHARLFENTPNDEPADSVLESKLLFGSASLIGGDNLNRIAQGEFARTGVLVGWNSGSMDGPEDISPADTHAAANFLIGETGLVELDRVVSVNNALWSGHVYDLQSSIATLYTSNGIVVKNCRCWDVLEYVGRVKENG
jgi:hypothetical protein